eukprot:4575355-Alexandrium_andersonii.AAC.1
MDMLEAAQDYVEQGHRVAVLSMAAKGRPGGGVKQGAGAQEENLHRRSDAFRFLEQQSWDNQLYPIPERACLLSQQ